MSKHTPGPWRVVDVPGEASHVIGANNFTVVRGGYVSDMDTANARLIAAAPDLLAALQLIANFSNQDVSDMVREIARAAIAKAEGTS
jgi:hypothetical protein